MQSVSINIDVPTPATPIFEDGVTGNTADDDETMWKTYIPINKFVGQTTGKPVVQIGFWGPSYSPLLIGDDGTTPYHDPGCFFNLTAFWTRRKNEQNSLIPSFTHCEMRFANGYVCSIHEYVLVPRRNYMIDHNDTERVSGTVHCRERELDRRDYYFIEMEVSIEQHQDMFLLAMDYARRNVPFNLAGMRLNFVFPFNWWCKIEKQGTAFFCSELITTLLQKGSIGLELHPSTTSPNDLWEYLNNLPNAFIMYNRNKEAEGKLASLKIPLNNNNNKPFSVGRSF